MKNVQYVDNANQEIDALKSILPAETAVVDVRFKDVLKGTALQRQPIHHSPDKL